MAKQQLPLLFFAKKTSKYFSPEQIEALMGENLLKIALITDTHFGKPRNDNADFNEYFYKFYEGVFSILAST